jgi:hypothetical protein
MGDDNSYRAQTVSGMTHIYRIQYVPPGQRSIVTTHRTTIPLELGMWLAVDGLYLIVERLVHSKRGDPYAGVALCKLATG